MLQGFAFLPSVLLPNKDLSSTLLIRQLKTMRRYLWTSSTYWNDKIPERGEYYPPFKNSLNLRCGHCSPVNLVKSNFWNCPALASGFSAESFSVVFAAELWRTLSLPPRKSVAIWKFCFDYAFSVFKSAFEICLSVSGKFEEKLLDFREKVLMHWMEYNSLFQFPVHLFPSWYIWVSHRKWRVLVFLEANAA